MKSCCKYRVKGLFLPCVTAPLQCLTHTDWFSVTWGVAALLQMFLEAFPAVWVAPGPTSLLSAPVLVLGAQEQLPELVHFVDQGPGLQSDTTKLGTVKCLEQHRIQIPWLWGQPQFSRGNGACATPSWHFLHWAQLHVFVPKVDSWEGRGVWNKLNKLSVGTENALCEQPCLMALLLFPSQLFTCKEHHPQRHEIQ